MTNEQFDKLVARLESQARNNPGWYRTRLFLLATLANVYFGAIIALVALTFVGLLAMVVFGKGLLLKPALIVGAILWVAVRALWVTIEAPDGFEVKRQQAPELFAMIDELRRALRAPRFHRVLITDDLNAGVVQSPRLGLFGWDRNYLLIGLPLLKTMSMDQFKAVLAHEFGHLARGDSRFSNRIYRQRLRWQRVVDELENDQSRGTFLFKPFLNWFSPYFSAFSFPLARANEILADATSARLTSPRAAAEALTSVNVLGGYLDEQFWPRIHKLADDHPQPNFAPFRELGGNVAQDAGPESLGRWLQQAMARETSSSNTHPALCDRLQAIGEQPRLALPEAGHSAARLLGDLAPKIEAHFDAAWKGNVSERWRNRFKQVQEGRAALAALDRRVADGEELSLQEHFDRARLTEDWGADPEVAIQQFRTLHERAPDDAFVNLVLGARLLAHDEPAGLALIDRAMAIDDDITLQAQQILRDHHWRSGNAELAEFHHQRFVDRKLKEELAKKERGRIQPTDKLAPHDLAADSLEELRTQVAAVEGLGKAWLVIKQVEHFPERICYMLAFTKKNGFLGRQKYTDDEVMYRLEHNVSYPCNVMIVNVHKDGRLRRKFNRVSGSRLA